VTVLSPQIRGQIRGQWNEAGKLLASAIGWVLFACGWIAAKSLRTIGWLIAAPLFAAGYVAARVAWPGLCWCGRAVKLGWQTGKVG
jgi:hypothetical protein